MAFNKQIPSEKPLDKDLLRSIFEQNWLHARHIETERLWFTNIYAMIMAGVLALIGKTEIPMEMYTPLILFLIMFSVIGIAVVIKLGLEFHQHVSYAVEIAESFSLGKYMGRPLAQYKVKRTLGDDFFTVAAMFLLFYIASLSGLVALLIYSLTNLFAISFVTFAVILFSFPILLKWQNNKYDEITQLVKQRVRKS